MGRGLSLTSWKVGGKSGTATKPTPWPDRPKGPVVWAHCPDATRLRLLVGLAERMALEGDWLHLLLTSADIPANVPRGPRTIAFPVPPDQPVQVRAALDHWRPDLILWMQGDLRPRLLNEAGGIPRILVDAQADRIRLAGGGWIPGALRQVLSEFDNVLALDDEAAHRLRRSGVAPERIEVTGPLDELGTVLPCNDAERSSLAQILGPRPVWLAAGVGPTELPVVLEAHRQASRIAHRLLLIIVPGRAEDHDEIATATAADGWTLALRAEGAEPDPATQVYLSDSLAELGLWYRLAPITFIGGTLPGEGGGRHPYEVAALGSALLHGPETAPHQEAYARLSRAGATRIVRQGKDLGQAVEALLSPDRAASMAHAAWDVTTAGAAVGNRLLDLIRDRIDRASH